MMDNDVKNVKNSDENIIELTDEVSESDEIDSYIDALYLKNHLIGYDTEQLKELYGNIDLYEYFVYSLIYILDNEPEFILLDDTLPNKIYDVLDLHRLDCKDDTILYGLVNEIILEVNSMKSLPNKVKEEKISVYLNEQSEKRKVLLTDREDLSYTMVYDAGVVLSLFEEGDEIPNEDMYIPSLNLLMSEMPVMFKDKKVLERAMNKLDEISKKHIIFGRLQKKYVRDAKVYLKKIGE